MEIDGNLKELCIVVVAGLDRNLSICSELEEQMKKEFGDEKKALDYLNDIATRIDDCDILKNDKWFGSRQNNGTYEFHTWDHDEEGRGLKVKLSEKQIRDIVSGNLKQIEEERAQYS